MSGLASAYFFIPSYIAWLKDTSSFLPGRIKATFNFLPAVSAEAVSAVDSAVVAAADSPAAVSFEDELPHPAKEPTTMASVRSPAIHLSPFFISFPPLAISLSHLK